MEVVCFSFLNCTIFFMAFSCLSLYPHFCFKGMYFFFSFPAVKFLKTSVTYSSFGESVDPKGLVDNFFIAGCCRKMFEDHHPRRSKKHYFYPHVGVCFFCYLFSLLTFI